MTSKPKQNSDWECLFVFNQPASLSQCEQWGRGVNTCDIYSKDKVTEI